MRRRTPEERVVDRVMRRLSRDLRLSRGKDRWRVVGVNHETTAGTPFGLPEARLTVELRRVRP